MKYLIFLIFLLQGCLNGSYIDEVRVYKMRTSGNIPVLVHIQNDDELISKLNQIKLENEVKVKVYPMYKIELFANGKIDKIFKVSGHIVFYESKSFRIEEDLEEYIAKNIKEGNKE